MYNMVPIEKSPPPAPQFPKVTSITSSSYGEVSVHIHSKNILFLFFPCPEGSKFYALFCTLLLLFNSVSWKCLYISLWSVLSLLFFLLLHRVPLYGWTIIHFKQMHSIPSMTAGGLLEKCRLSAPFAVLMHLTSVRRKLPTVLRDRGHGLFVMVSVSIHMTQCA